MNLDLGYRTDVGAVELVLHIARSATFNDIAGQVLLRRRALFPHAELHQAREHLKAAFVGSVDVF